MFLCKFASDQPQILRWWRRFRWWILTLTDVTNADFCTFAFLLHSDLATVATVQQGSYRRYFSRSWRFVDLRSLARIQGVQACTRSRENTYPPPLVGHSTGEKVRLDDPLLGGDGERLALCSRRRRRRQAGLWPSCVRRGGFLASRRRPPLRYSKQGAWHGCSDPTPKRQPPLPGAKG
jgi:hypothetical protein